MFSLLSAVLQLVVSQVQHILRLQELPQVNEVELGLKAGENNSCTIVFLGLNQGGGKLGRQVASSSRETIDSNSFLVVSLGLVGCLSVVVHVCHIIIK
jgi:hypothetical protein